MMQLFFFGKKPLILDFCGKMLYNYYKQVFWMSVRNSDVKTDKIII